MKTTPTATRVVPDPAGRPLMRFTYDPATELLVGEWLQDLSPEVVRLGATATFERLVEWPARWALSDGSHVAGDWLDLLPWLEYELMPLLATNGLRAIAYWITLDPATQLGLSLLQRATDGALPIATFTDEPSARRWLVEQGAPRAVA